MSKADKARAERARSTRARMPSTTAKKAPEPVPRKAAPLHRSAKTGRAVTAEHAEQNPETTVTERNKRLSLDDIVSFKMPSFKLPKSAGQIADIAYELREQRYAVQKICEELRRRQTECEEYFINNMAPSDTGAAGRRALAQVEKKEAPQVQDWDALQKYIKKSGAFDLLQRRVNDKAIMDRFHDGKTVPGVTTQFVKKVSLTKVKGAK